MFKSFLSKIRGLFEKMGLLQSVKEVSDRTNFLISDNMHNHIQWWLALYKGYLPKYKDEPFHDITYTTLNGQKTRRMLSLGMPKVISSEMANLVFNEQCSINISDENFNEFIEKTLDDNGFYDKFQNYLEYMFATGGMVIKVNSPQPKINQQTEQKINLSFVHADSFIPLTYDGKRIMEGIFVNETVKGKYYYTLMEIHTWENGVYTITNRLFKSESKADLGKEVALSEMYGELAELIEIPGLKQPLFVYFKPNTANNIDLYSPLGTSIFSGCMDTLKTLDTIYDSYQREFKLGKKKIIVPATAVKAIPDENGNMRRYFDADQEAYEALNLETDDDSIKEISFELRVQQHIDGINHNLNILATQIGFSAGAFTFDSKGLKTATEIVSENSKTYRTRNGHVTLIEEGLIDLIDVIGDVADLYELYSKPEEYEVTINFDDSIAEDRTSDAAYWMSLSNSGLVPKWYALMKILKTTEEEAKQLVSSSMEETPQQTELFGDGV